MSTLNIAIIVGTTRHQRQTIYAARLVEEIGHGIKGINTVLVDPINFVFHGDGNDPEGKDPRYTKIAGWADAYFIVTPEYNHSFPGSLKRLLDSELALYNHKPVAFAGTSSGHWGGVRAIEALVGSVREMGLVASSVDVQFPNVQDLFEHGQLKAEYHQLYHDSISRAYEELIWLGHALKSARAKRTS